MKKRGGILVFVVAALIVVSLLLLSITRTQLLSHRQLGDADQLSQAEWLAESAAQRWWHAHRDAIPTDSSEETWEVPADSLNRRAPMFVSIVAKPAPAAEDSPVLHIAVFTSPPQGQAALFRCELAAPRSRSGD
ncbi:MAG: hypothetical protein AB7F89_20020 [Pirellulaceae bacterium]